MEETHEVKFKNSKIGLESEKIGQFISFYQEKSANPEDPYHEKINTLKEKAKIVDLGFIEDEDPQNSKLEVKAQPGYAKKFVSSGNRHSIVGLINLFNEHRKETMTTAKLDLKKKKRLDNAICYPNILHKFKETHQGCKLTLSVGDEVKIGKASKFQKKTIKALIMDLYTK